jgi:NitT/TauT family transport system substrate-binding protein
MITVRTTANHGAVIYLPEAVALALGYFAAEGLRVEPSDMGPGPGPVQAVLAGLADVFVGGLWRPAMYLGLGQLLVAFAAVAVRCQHYLLFRPGLGAAGWRGLEGRSVILGGDSPSSWVVFQDQCSTRGVALSRVRLIPALPPGEGARLFAAGFGDYIYFGQPWTEELLTAGKAELLASMAVEAGPLPWSVFMATPAYLAQHPDRARKLSRALRRALQWIARSSPAEIAAAVARDYPHIAPALLELIVERYKGEGMWPVGPAIEPGPVAAWERLLLSGGLLRQPVNWDLLVDNRFLDKEGA